MKLGLVLIIVQNFTPISRRISEIELFSPNVGKVAVD